MEVKLAPQMSLMDKLKILADAAKYDVSCSSSGSSRKNDGTGLGNTVAAGLCEYPAGCLAAMQSHFRCVALNAEETAEKLGSAKCMNVVLFGAMAKALNLDHIDWEAVIRRVVPEKFLTLNLAAYRAGRAVVK